MALNKAVFKTRTLTAIVFAGVMLAGLFINFLSFLLLITVIHFGCWFEYLKITEQICKTKLDPAIKWFFAVCGITFVIVFGIQHLWVDIGKQIGGVTISFKVIFWMVLFIGLLIFLIQNKMIPAKAKSMMLAGFLYISVPLASFLYLKEYFTIYMQGNIFGILLPCAVILSIWINDTMAYIVGSFIGKTPFSKISPKKTWEGTIGGALLSVGVMALLGNFLPVAQQLALHHWIWIAAICSVFGTAGDLLESKIKRVAGIKDSGSFMPGHGGFLDRFDSLLIATPFVWLYAMRFIL